MSFIYLILIFHTFFDKCYIWQTVFKKISTSLSSEHQSLHGFSCSYLDYLHFLCVGASQILPGTS